MKVWILFLGDCFGHQTIEGVFDNEEKAIKAAEFIANTKSFYVEPPKWERLDEYNWELMGNYLKIVVKEVK